MELDGARQDLRLRGLAATAIHRPYLAHRRENSSISMKILVPILGFGRAGGNRVLSQLANTWVHLGHEVTFLAPSAGSPPYFPTLAKIVWSDASGRLNEAAQPPEDEGKASGRRNVMSLWRGLRKLKGQYDIVLANHCFTAWATALACPRSKLFYYVQAYEPEYFELSNQPLHQWLARISYRLPLHQIANAPIYCGYREIKAVDWVPPGLDMNIFRPKLAQSLRCDSDEFVIGCIGRSEPTKGTEYVLAAFERLFQINTRFRLRVAYGNLPHNYSHPAVEVVVPGNDRELAEFYRSIDVMVAVGTVQHGAAHYPVLEAMACGIPVVTTGYLPASNENAWLVPNKDPVAIVAAIEEIARDTNAAQKANKALNDIQSYSWDVVATNMLAIFLQK